MGRKIIASFALVCASFLCGAVAMADVISPKTPRLVTVSEAKSLPDDTKVSMRGYIVKRVRDDIYLFEDSSGSMYVEIDDDEWDGVDVRTKDRVEISGEVDRDHDRVKIDVERLKILKK